MSIDDRLRDALDRAWADARTRLEPDLRALTHELSEQAPAAMVAAAEALDRADSLGGVLRELAAAAGQHAERVGLFLLRDGRARAWHLNGIDPASLTAADADRVAAFPLIVGGQVVAILCVDAPSSHAGALDMLTRYAGRLLESRTLHTALGITAR